MVPPGENTQGTEATKEPRRGVRAKICVVDYDGDGRLDLLLGDYASHRRSKLTPQEQAKQARAYKDLVEVVKQYRELDSKLSGPQAVKDKIEREKAEKEIQAVDKRRQELLKDAIPCVYEHHGWVWLFKRTPAKRSVFR